MYLENGDKWRMRQGVWNDHSTSESIKKSASFLYISQDFIPEKEGSRSWVSSNS